jgi:lysophospholipase L1-like esterase
MGLRFNQLLRAMGGGAPVTVNLTYAQFDQGGVAGPTDTTRTAGRIFWAAGNTFWYGLIKGTVATITASHTGTPNGAYEVSVDGGAFTALNQVSGSYTLFTGLSDINHVVIIRIGGAFGNNAFFLSTGTVFSCTGVAAGITKRFVSQPYDITGNASWSCAFTQPAATYNNPPKRAAMFGVNTTAGSSIPVVRFSSALTQIWVYTNQLFVFVSVDNAAPTRYSTGASPTASAVFNVPATFDGTTHTYNVWSANVNGAAGVFYVYADSALLTLTNAGRIDQYGDSITRGAGSTSSGDVDTMQVGAMLGRVGSTYGIDGNTIATLQARMSAALLVKDTDNTKDVAIIAIGRNDTLWDATAITNYTDIINQLLVKYKTIICRGVLPEGANIWPTVNNGISALVTSIGNANVKWMPTSAWTGIATADGTHPTDAGYVQIRNYELADLPALL